MAQWVNFVIMNDKATFYFLIHKTGEYALSFFPNDFIDAVADAGRVNIAFDDADTFQCVQVLGYRGLRPSLT